MVTVVNYKHMEKAIEEVVKGKLMTMPIYGAQRENALRVRQIPRAHDISAWTMRTAHKHIMKTGAGCRLIDIDFSKYSDFREKQAAMVNMVYGRYSRGQGNSQSNMQTAWDMVRSVHVSRALENNEPLYWYTHFMGPALVGFAPDELSLVDVLDFVIGTPDDIEKHLKRSWPEAKAAAQKWHDAMKAKKETIKFTDDCPVYLDLGDMKWVYLKTKAEKVRESDAMGHCVGRGGYDHAFIFSLRTKTGKPQVTVEWNNGIRQARGKFNNVVPENCKEALAKLEETLQKDPVYTTQVKDNMVSTPIGLGYIRPLEWEEVAVERMVADVLQEIGNWPGE